MKKIVLFLIIFLSVQQTVFAQKIPVRITPSQIISTKADEVEIGDWLNFVVVSDVYLNNKIYIKKGTPIIGFVDFVHPNGWAGDNAEIKFKTFKTTDINKNLITINYPLNLDGNTLKANDTKQYLSWVLTIVIRGSEIYIEPDTKVFNIFIEE